jgi:hypothetical protein
MTTPEKQSRWAIFRALLPYYGTIVPAKFIQRTSEYIPGITRIHNLIEGIYKPKGSDYALSIASMQVNPYADKLTYLPDGRWYIQYSAKSGGKDLAVNQGLFRCMQDHEPVIVLQQVSDKTGKQGTQYRLMGLGLLDSYDASRDVFSVQHVDFATLEQVSYGEREETIIASALRSSILEDFIPFVAEDRAIYKVSSQKRDQAFKDVVLEQYAFTCAVTGMQYHSDHLVEAQAAHIIAKQHKGSDDPRNGIALSRTSHWAFDKGMFTISDQYDIIVHPKARNAASVKFPILDLHGQPMARPDDEAFLPHKDALAWHKEEVFDRFRT